MIYDKIFFEVSNITKKLVSLLGTDSVIWVNDKDLRINCNCIARGDGNSLIYKTDLEVLFRYDPDTQEVSIILNKEEEFGVPYKHRCGLQIEITEYKFSNDYQLDLCIVTKEGTFIENHPDPKVEDMIEIIKKYTKFQSVYNADTRQGQAIRFKAKSGDVFDYVFPSEWIKYGVVTKEAILDLFSDKTMESIVKTLNLNEEPEMDEVKQPFNISEIFGVM